MLINSRMLGRGGMMKKTPMQKFKMMPKMMNKSMTGNPMRNEDFVKMMADGGLLGDPTDPKPKQKGLYFNDEGAFIPSELGQQQEYAGVNPNNEGEFVTQGDFYAEGNRINNVPGYTGNTENITRDKYNQYLEAQKTFDNQDVTFNDDGTITNSVENPFAGFENSALGNSRLMKDFNRAFADENLNSLDYVTGQFAQPENDINTINETERDFAGISQYNRSRDFVPEPDTVGVPPENLSNFKMPLSEPRALLEPQVQQETSSVSASPKASFGSYGTTKRQKYLNRQNKKRLGRATGGKIKIKPRQSASLDGGLNDEYINMF